ncbi:MAG: hypothetical protein ACI9R3_005326 [Verrucomicrobiales bacterium]|jgi:hypothetical protein
MLKPIKSSLLVQALGFILVFAGFFVVESRSSSGVGFDNSLLVYITWMPAMWGGIVGGFPAYFLLILAAVVSLALPRTLTPHAHQPQQGCVRVSGAVDR